MRDEEILQALKEDRDYRRFCNGAESFIKRWAPIGHPYQHIEFTADLMGLFRELLITRHQISCEVSAQYFKQSMELTMRQPSAPVFVGVDRGREPSFTSIWVRGPDGVSRPATPKEIAEINRHKAEKTTKGTTDET